MDGSITALPPVTSSPQASPRLLQRLAGTCPPGHPAVALTKASPPGPSCLFFLAQTNLARLRISIGSTSFSLIISRPSLSFPFFLLSNLSGAFLVNKRPFLLIASLCRAHSPPASHHISHLKPNAATQPAAVQFPAAKSKKRNKNPDWLQNTNVLPSTQTRKEITRTRTGLPSPLFLFPIIASI